MKTSALITVLAALLLLVSDRGLCQKPYRGAEYRTIATMTYGRFEVRMRSAGTSGMLSSFFTYYDPASPWNEIDIENMGRYTNEVQYNTIVPWQGSNHVQRQPVLFNPHAGFHTYAIEWTPAYVAWRIDGEEMYRQTGSHIDLITKAQKLMMNIWQPSDVAWAGSFSPAQLPVYAYYDWVKYYRYTPGSGDDFTLDWSDEFTTFDTARWQKATHTWDGNNAQFVVENAVLKDGYLVLCLTSNTTSGYSGGAIPTGDTDAPFPVGAWAYDSTVVIRFSEPLDPSSAQTLANYFGGSGITYKSAMLRADGRTVDLTVSGMNLATPFILFSQNVKDLAVPANTMALKTTRVTMPLSFPILLDVGGDGSGSFLADSAWTVTKQYGSVGGTRILIPAETLIVNAGNSAMVRSSLRGISGYKVRVPNGVYKVTMWFVEDRFTQAGKRVFAGYIEGKQAFGDMDIFKTTGGRNSALSIVTSGVTVTDNVLDMTFVASVDSTTLSGLVIEKEGGPVGVRDVAPEDHDMSFSIYPNPMNAAAKFRLYQTVAGPASITIFDQLGRRVSSLQLGDLQAGRHEFVWAGDGLASGMYYCVFRAGGGTLVRRALLMK
jgi:beta-glucanase (GH16 family)